MDTKKRLFTERVVSCWNRQLQGSGPGTKPVRVQGVPGQCSDTWFSLSSLAGSTVGLNDPYGSLQLEIFYDSIGQIFLCFSQLYVVKEVRLCDCNGFSQPTNCVDDYASTWSLTEAAVISSHTHKSENKIVLYN